MFFGTFLSRNVKKRHFLSRKTGFRAVSQKKANLLCEPTPHFIPLCEMQYLFRMFCISVLLPDLGLPLPHLSLHLHRAARLCPRLSAHTSCDKILIINPPHQLFQNLTICSTMTRLGVEGCAGFTLTKSPLRNYISDFSERSTLTESNEESLRMNNIYIGCLHLRIKNTPPQKKKKIKKIKKYI